MILFSDILHDEDVDAAYHAEMESDQPFDRLLSECADCEAFELEAMDTDTLRSLRDSIRAHKQVLASAYMNTSDRDPEPLKQIAARLRRINAALDFKDGLTA